MRFNEDIAVSCNFRALLRERGKYVAGSVREGHNVFTVTGRNWLSKLMAWQTIASTDIPYTGRRVRWLGVGTGSQLEVTTVFALNQPHLITSANYMVPIATTEFPTSTSVKFITELGTNQVNIADGVVNLSEAGLYVDVLPVVGSEDVAVNPGTVDTTLDPSIGTNPPAAYHAFEALPKTVDFVLQVEWEFRL